MGMSGTMSGGSMSGNTSQSTNNYNNLINKPLVNGSELAGGANINLIPQTVGAIRYSSILGLNRGALVFYDNALFMNISGDFTVGGAFDPSKWTLIRISNLFVNNLNNILGGYYTNQWSNSGSYVLEDIVIYNGLIYACIVDNATTGTFVNNEWAQISVYKLLDDKKQDALTFDETPTENSTNPVESGGVYDAIADVSDKVAQLEVTGEASGSIATFDDGSANPIIELTAQIEAVQSGTGEPSPSNIRPISGWDGANVGDTSDKGQFFKGLVFGSYKSVDMGDLNWQYDSTNAYFRADISDLKQASLNLLCADYTTGTQNDPANITNNMITSASSSTYVYIKDSNYTNANTFKTALSGKHLVYELATPITPTITLTQFTDLLIEFGLDGWLQSISWQTQCGTVYGGNFKLFKDGGKWYCTVTATKVKISPKWSDFSKSALTTNVRGTYTFSTPKGLYPPSSSSAQLCNVAPFLQNFSSDTVHFYCNATQGIVTLPPNTDGDTTIELVYELETPTTTTFEIDTEIATLLGDNNIFADCGDVDVKYIRDLNLVIEDLEQGGGGGTTYTAGTNIQISAQNVISATDTKYSAGTGISLSGTTINNSQAYTELTGTLNAGSTSLTLSNAVITTSKTFDYYTSIFGVNPTNVTVSSGSMTLTFEAQSSNMNVKVRVS